MHKTVLEGYIHLQNPDYLGEGDNGVTKKSISSVNVLFIIK